MPYYHISDSSNYIIDGIAEALYSKLQLVGDLTVRPWTSVIKYRNSGKSIPEIAEELKVNYIVEFICQNFTENDFNITVSLINVALDSPTSLGNYQGTIDNIDTIEKELSVEVAKEINATVTPEENVRMEKVPTNNKTARKYYLLGLQKQKTDAKIAIQHFNKAIENDDRFALAYAELANSYSILDTGINRGIYTDTINHFADKAILFDNENDKCLIPKAKTLISQYNYELAVKYLEKAVEYNPNSAVSYRLIASCTIIGGAGLANSEICVENALKAVKYNLLEENSEDKSIDYGHLARALRTAGFYIEALNSIAIAMELNPENNSFLEEKCEILIDSSSNYNIAINLLKKELEMAPTDYRMNYYLFKNYYHIGDFKNAYKSYNNLISNLNYQPRAKDLSRLAMIYNNLGMHYKSDSCILLLEKQINTENYSNYLKTELLLRLYSFKNDIPNAIDQLKKLNQFKNIFSVTIRPLKDEPIFKDLQQHPEFQEILTEMEEKFMEQKEQIRKSMVTKGLL